MAELVQSMDWSQTPLGPIDKWPQSLKTTVSLCLASNFPISIAWGPQRVQIYNDGYWPICGDKHPTSLGQDYKECWLSAWPAIGEAFEQASQGQTRFLENQRMFLERFGYLEETFFTFSFSPILDESGGVGGLFHPVTELTQQTLAERRLNILQALSDRTVDAQTTEQACFLILETFKEFELDLPFVLLYSLAADGKEAKLIGNEGIEANATIVPAKINLAANDSSGWPLSELVQNGKLLRVDELAKKFGPFSCGPYPEPPQQALVSPVFLSNTQHPAYVLILGVSARRALDEKYLLFYELLIAAVTNTLTKARAYEEERKRAEALAKLDRAKTAFFSNISHEFRTPLTLILGPAEDALADKNHPLPLEQQERLQLVYKNSLRLQRLVNSLLDFSQIEAGRLKASFQEINLAEFTTNLASIFRAAIEKAGLNFIVDCRHHPAPVFVDPDMWEKIVFNLLSNALKFTFTGQVALLLKEENDHIWLSVSDTGEGIPKEELANLFQRFNRVAGTKARTHEGLGIGLAFVQKLVKLHGGSISVESTRHEGTTFTVSIPTGSAHLPPDRIINQPAEIHLRVGSTVFINESLEWLATPVLTAGEDLFPEVTANPHQAVTRILVVDDNADMREYIVRILSQNPLWKIKSAADGLQALKAVNKQKPDLVLSDIMMPQLDGFGLLKKLKEDPATAPIPVILLSVQAGEEATIEGLEKGADDYLVKPFSARELVARVRTQLEITHTRQNNTQLQASQEELKKYKIISDYAFDAFILMRADGSFAYLNDLARQRWGYTQEEALHIRVPDVDPIYQEKEFRKVFALAQSQRIPPFETIHKKKDGTIYPVEVSMGSITMEGEPHLFAVARDITERKQAEETLKARNEELLKTNNDLDNFIYTASHDLKTPILNIEGLMEVLLDQLPPESLQSEPVQRTTDLIIDSVQRFKRTIEHLTEVAKLQKEHNPEASFVEVAPLIAEVQLDLAPAIQATRAQIEVNVTGCPAISFSKKNLRSIIYNLLSNAIKYHSPDRLPQVRLHCWETADYHVLSVQDNGLGFDLAQEHKLFMMFKRLHNHVEGTGIGLYMVKKMIDNAGGKIQVQSTINKGSTFQVYFRHYPA